MSWLKALGRWLYRGLLLCCWALLCLYLTFKLFERAHFIDALPAAIEPAGVVLISGESGFREGCGVAVFRLSGDSRDALAANGLAALAGAQQARGYTDAYYSYAAWQGTPVPEAYSSEGWPPLSCAAASDELERRILLAMQRPGGFYTHKHEALLLVLPEEGLIVFGYFG